MVLYFEPLHHGPGKEDFLVYMGRDKLENEDLIRYGLPHDVWYVFLVAALRSILHSIRHSTLVLLQEELCCLWLATTFSI